MPIALIIIFMQQTSAIDIPAAVTNFEFGLYETKPNRSFAFRTRKPFPLREE
jgi:hypothetical protein